MRDDVGSSDLMRLSRLLLAELRQDRGVRIGESTVLSRKVHTLLPQEPTVVYINALNDAGQVFYFRPRKNEVLHMDIFHEVGEVDHIAVAEAVRHTVTSWFGDPMFQKIRGLAIPSTSEILDFIDIQTGTGGGRVTGALNYGKKPSLLRAHKNHVHLALMVPESCLSLLVFLADAIEKVIMRQGLEIRKIERIVGTGETKGTPQNLEQYSSLFDSKLTSHSASGMGADWAAMGAEMKLEAISGLAEEFGGAANLLSFLEAVKSSKAVMPADVTQDIGDVEDLAGRLESLGLVKRDRFRTILTERGAEVETLLRSNFISVEAGVRRLLRKIPLSCGFHATEKGPMRTHRKEYGRLSREARPLMEHELADAIAVPETAIAALVRRGMTGDTRSFLTRDDLRVGKRRPSRGPEICLLVDSSASMVGKRIRAAKHLVRHLALATDFRITVLTFQERAVSLRIASTRNPRVIENGLSAIRPAGLTPLASGICEALDFIKAKKLKNILMVLITDGIPTMNRWTADPAKDAITAAKRIAQEKVPFVCIGLQPNREFLRRLCEVSGGRFYVLDEFDRDILVSLVRKEGSPFRI